SFTRMLGGAHEVVTATRAAQALQLLRRSAFDVVFCDLMMPEMTGMELYRRLLREMPDVAERVVFMTGGTFGSGVEEVLAGVDNGRVGRRFDRARVLALIESG